MNGGNSCGASRIDLTTGAGRIHDGSLADVDLRIMVATSLTACGDDCQGFSADPAQDAVGAASPAEALAFWVKEGNEHKPAKGWFLLPDSAHAHPGDQTFINGDWTVTVTAAPEGGWLVTGGATC